MWASRRVSSRFCPEEGEGEIDALDFAEPFLGLGSGVAGQKVGLDLVEAWQHFRVYGEHRASQTRVLMLAWDPVWPHAAAQFNLSPVEVLLEFAPFLPWLTSSGTRRQGGHGGVAPGILGSGGRRPR